MLDKDSAQKSTISEHYFLLNDINFSFISELTGSIMIAY